MEDKVFNELNHVHFEQQIWHNEIEMINLESKFFRNA